MLLRAADFAEVLLDFRRPGPIGPCSTEAGTNELALKTEDVGDTVPFKRTMGDACFDPVCTR